MRDVLFVTCPTCEEQIKVGTVDPEVSGILCTPDVLKVWQDRLEDDCRFLELGHH